MELQKMFIDGSWVEGSGGKSAPTYNPANGEILAMMTEGTEEDVKKAVAAPSRRRRMSSRSWTAWIWANLCGKRRLMWTTRSTVSATTPGP